MALVEDFIRIDRTYLEPSRMAYSKAKENWSNRTGLLIMVVGWRINLMEAERSIGPTEPNTSGPTRQVRRTVMGRLYGWSNKTRTPKRRYIKVTLKMTYSMVKVNTSGLMEGFMMALGRLGRWTDMVVFVGLTVACTKVST